MDKNPTKRSVVSRKHFCLVKAFIWRGTESAITDFLCIFFRYKPHLCTLPQFLLLGFRSCSTHLRVCLAWLTLHDKSSQKGVRCCFTSVWFFATEIISSTFVLLTIAPIEFMQAKCFYGDTSSFALNPSNILVYCLAKESFAKEITVLSRGSFLRAILNWESNSSGPRTDPRYCRDTLWLSDFQHKRLSGLVFA